MLYVVVCAAGATRLVPDCFLPVAAERGWDTYVLATEQAADAFGPTMREIEAATGRPVRTGFHTTVGYSLPDPDAVIVAPATFNTIRKMALGVADTYVLTRIAEQVGRGVPIVVGPYVNADFARHPVYEASLATLREWGVRIIVGPREPHTPGGSAAEGFPWAELLDAVEPDTN